MMMKEKKGGIIQESPRDDADSVSSIAIGEKVGPPIHYKGEREISYEDIQSLVIS